MQYDFRGIAQRKKKESEKMNDNIKRMDIERYKDLIRNNENKLRGRRVNRKIVLKHLRDVEFDMAHLVTVGNKLRKELNKLEATK